MVLGTIDVVLVTEDADAHVWTRDARELDGARETLVTLRVIVLEADLEFDRLEEVSLFGILAVVKELFDVCSDAGDSWKVVSMDLFSASREKLTDFRHLGC